MERPSRPDLWSRAADAWFRANAPLRAVPCPSCGYDLRGLPAPGGVLRCPECGTSGPRYRMMGPMRVAAGPGLAMAAAVAVGLGAVWLTCGGDVTALVGGGGLLAWLALNRLDRWRGALRPGPPGVPRQPPARSAADRALRGTLREGTSFSGDP